MLDTLPDELLDQLLSHLGPSWSDHAPYAATCRACCSSVLRRRALTLSLTLSHPTAPTLRAVVRCCPQLHTLTLRRTPRPAAAALLARGCASLHTLLLDEECEPDGLLLALAAAPRRLLALRLAGCRALSDAALLAVARAGSLTSLDLHGCATPTDAALAAVAAASPRLTSLDLAFCPRVGGAALRALAAHCPRLVHLDAAAAGAPRGVLDDACVALLATGCPRLAFVGLGGAPLLSTDGVAALLRHRRPELRHVDLRGCPRLTDQVARLLAAGAPALEELHLNDCPQLTDAAAPFLTRLPCLAWLDLSGCVKLTDETVRAVASGCVSLRRLRLNRCAKMHTSVLAVAAREHPQLWISKDRWEFGRSRGKWSAQADGAVGSCSPQSSGGDQLNANGMMGSPTSVMTPLMVEHPSRWADLSL
ncbi:hypothetical protein AB1Y20_018245 [Prymnesium parvum]|uniref:F-box/LRR-repeat protein 15-like leucin rich repeat domain-containing protein n=1 Tax=Prymnesium parvum TaxID=97485 RepID=A0AB34JR92_PRYPA